MNETPPNKFHKYIYVTHNSPQKFKLLLQQRSQNNRHNGCVLFAWPGWPRLAGPGPAVLFWRPARPVHVG